MFFNDLFVENLYMFFVFIVEHLFEGMNLKLTLSGYPIYYMAKEMNVFYYC